MIRRDLFKSALGFFGFASVGAAATSAPEPEKVMILKRGVLVELKKRKIWGLYSIDANRNAWLCRFFNNPLIAPNEELAQNIINNLKKREDKIPDRFKNLTISSFEVWLTDDELMFIHRQAEHYYQRSRFAKTLSLHSDESSFTTLTCIKPAQNNVVMSEYYNWIWGGK